MILQVAFLSCTGMLTVMTSSVHYMRHTLKRTHRIGLAVQSPYSLPLKDSSAYTEVCRNIQKLPADNITCTPSINMKTCIEYKRQTCIKYGHTLSVNVQCKRIYLVVLPRTIEKPWICSK